MVFAFYVPFTKSCPLASSSLSVWFLPNVIFFATFTLFPHGSKTISRFQWSCFLALWQCPSLKIEYHLSVDGQVCSLIEVRRSKKCGHRCTWLVSVGPTDGGRRRERSQIHSQGVSILVLTLRCQERPLKHTQITRIIFHLKSNKALDKRSELSRTTASWNCRPHERNSTKTSKLLWDAASNQNSEKGGTHVQNELNGGLIAYQVMVVRNGLSTTPCDSTDRIVIDPDAVVNVFHQYHTNSEPVGWTVFRLFGILYSTSLLMHMPFLQSGKKPSSRIQYDNDFISVALTSILMSA